MSFTSSYYLFYNIEPTKINKGLTNRITNSSLYFYIVSCFFNMISITGTGGAINIQNQNCFLLIDYTLFNQCFSTNNGGAINFGTTNDGGCIIYRVCGVNCRGASTSIG